MRRHLDSALTDRRSLGRIVDLAERLPGEVHGVFEAPLRGPVVIDFSIRLPTPALARRAASGLTLPAVSALADRWQADPEIGRVVSALWLEFDLSERPVRSPPLVCARLERRCDPHWLTGVLMPALVGRPLARPQAATLHRLLAELPESVRLLYVFDLSPRGAGAVRLELFGPSPEEMIPYLWRTTDRTLAQQLAEPIRVLADLDRYHLSLDVDRAGEVSSRVGLDGSYRRLPTGEPRWAALFDRLVAAGWCSRRKRSAVFAWPGCDSFWTDSTGWPLPGGGVGGYCVRALSHVKLVTAAGREPQAKAYLLFGHLAATRKEHRGSRLHPERPRR